MPVKQKLKRITTKQKEILRVALIYMGVAVSLLFIFWLKAVLLPFIIAFVLAYLLNPTVDYFEKKGIKRVLVILSYFFIVFSVVTVLLAVFIDFTAKEIMILQSKLPYVSEKVESIVEEYSLKAEKVFPGFKPAELKTLLVENTQKLTAEISKSIVGMFSNIVNWISSAAGSMMNILIVLFSLFYMLKDWKKIKEAVKKTAPVTYHGLVEKLAGSVGFQINRYIRGQIIVASTVGVIAMLGLYFLGFEYYFILGVITGLSNLIPVIGPFIGIAVGTVLSLFIHEPFIFGVLKVAGVLLSVQLLDNILISPLIIGKAVKIHPVTVLIVLSFGWYFLGILGMLISIPFYTTMKFVAAEVYCFHVQNQ
jgi:predicted PurR-regulated permease PerM